MIIDRDALYIGLDRVRRAVDRKSYEQLLQNAYLSWEEDRLTISVFNQGVYLRVHIECETDGTGNVALDPEKMFRLVETMPEGAMKVSIDQERFKVSMKAGSSTLKIPGMNPANYPTWIRPLGQLAECNWSDIGVGIRLMEKIKPNPASMPILRSGYMVSDGKCMEFVTTDSYRLATFKFPCSGDPIEGSIISRDHLANISRLFNDGDNIRLRFEDDCIWFVTDYAEAGMRKIDKNYVPYKRISEAPRLTTTLIDRSEIDRIITQAMVYYKNSDKEHGEPCTVRLTEGKMEIEMSEMRSFIMTDVIGDDFELSIYPYMIRDAIDSIKTQKVVVWANAQGHLIGIEGGGTNFVSIGRRE